MKPRVHRPSDTAGLQGKPPYGFTGGRRGKTSWMAGDINLEKKEE